jgi:hypothetical protein
VYPLRDEIWVVDPYANGLDRIQRVVFRLSDADPRIRIGWSECSSGCDLIQTVGSDRAAEIARYPFDHLLC